MADIVAILKEVPAIIMALGALIVSVQSSRSTRRKVNALDERMEGAERVRDVAGKIDGEALYHERLAIAHFRKALRVPDDMRDPADAYRSQSVTPPSTAAPRPRK